MEPLRGLQVGHAMVAEAAEIGQLTTLLPDIAGVGVSRRRHSAAHDHPETTIASTHNTFHSEFARMFLDKGYVEGLSRGWAEGQALSVKRGIATGRMDGMVEACLKVLAARGIDLTVDLCHRISEHTDPDELGDLIRRAAKAKTSRELFP